TLPSGWSVSDGRLSGAFTHVRGPSVGNTSVSNAGARNPAVRDALSWALRIGALSFSSAAGDIASEGLDTVFTGQLEHSTSPGTSGAGNLAISAGAMVGGPAYVEFARAPATLAWRTKPGKQGGESIWHGELDHTGIGRAEIDLVLGGEGGLTPLSATLDIAGLQLASVTKTYLAGWLASAGIDKAEIAGTALAKAHWRAPHELDVQVQLDDVRFDDGRGRAAVAGLRGRSQWRNHGLHPSEPNTTMQWDGASLLGVALGPVRVSGTVYKRDFELDQEIRVPVLDGSLDVATFRVSQIGQDDFNWHLSADLTPTTMEAVSETFGWPSFSGELAGSLEGVHYAQGALVVDGGLDVRVFDGLVSVTQLSIDSPFGVLPRLSADVDVDGISLGELTGAFSFGAISGRLNGRVRDLQLVDWRVDSFDASVRTPPGDASRKRISQRAVDNIAQIGGGPSALLSGTFLRFFEEFSYEALGISCRLKDGVCAMGGLEGGSDEGYFLVRGRGIPSISVKGFSRRVDWNALIARLTAAMNSPGPEIR
ncbi:MAG: hypothetical protein ACI9W2_004700, partial [Gammaproteobacteria bacterium]